ncbi:3-hydroxyacyl-ACP dehydratase FabZ family protein [Actinophytocola sp.]|uniref:3-hydroxyacyl-ACP dehydratase FabZ family protein n=1 Tax=Actinophytocola sp. TaxID=1872138 RepID=UPI003D6B65CA
MTATAGPCVLRAPVTVTARNGRAVTAVVPVRAEEPVLAGHYPGFPVLPGVCVIECVDRAALAAPPGTVELAAIDSARFLGPVHPGDELTVELVWSAEGGDWCCRAEASTVRGRTATVRLRYRDRPPEPEAAGPRGLEAGARLGVDEITRLIPHRPPMLLLDRVDGLVPGERLTATRTVRADEPWCAGRSAYPAVLVVESWCQAAGVLAVYDAPGLSAESGRVMLLGGVQGVELAGPVSPGDRVEHLVRLSASATDAGVLTGESCVDGRVVLRVRRIVVAMRPAAELEVG